MERSHKTKSKTTTERHESKTSLASEPTEEERQAKVQRRLERRARKKAQAHLDALGLDANGNPIDTAPLEYPLKECQFSIGTGTMVLNPVVTLIVVAMLWGVVVWSTVNPTGSLATLVAGRSYLTSTFGWLLQGSKAVLFFFLVYIVYRYGHIRLGKGTVEFSNYSWCAMIFTSNVGPALLYYSVSEPLFHLNSHYYAQAGYRSEDERANHGLFLSIYEWTIVSFVPACTVAVAASLSVHCFKMPLAFRSCLYPILGPYTWGWIGDGVDGLVIVFSMMSVCTNLCMTTIPIVAGLTRLGWIDAESTLNEITDLQKVTVWIITFISTASVVSGLHYGVRIMAVLATSLALFLIFVLFILDDSKFLLNLFVQQVGYSLQHGILQVNFWTDAFGQLDEGSGRAVDGKAAEQWWMSSWILFYQAWVMALSCVFGVFVARISRGRHLWELVTACGLVPSLLLVIWFCTYGGIGLRQARQGLELEHLGETYYNNSGHFLADGSDLCYDVPQSDVMVNDQVIFTNHLPGVTPVCQFDEEQAGLAVFNVFDAFTFPGTFGFGNALSALYIMCCALFYIALSDSTSLIVDTMASNGRTNNNWVRRMFWASSVGAVTTTLLGSGDALKAVEAAVIVGALPAALLLCALMPCIVLYCRAADQRGNGTEMEYIFPNQAEFTMPVFGGICNVMEYLTSWGNVHEARVQLGMHQPSRLQVIEFVQGLLVPFVSLHQILAESQPSWPKTNRALVAWYAVCHVSGIILWSNHGWTGLCTILLTMSGTTLAIVRAQFRTRYQIRSHYVADWLTSVFLWPQVVAQMRLYKVSLPPLVSEKAKVDLVDHGGNNDSQGEEVA